MNAIWVLTLAAAAALLTGGSALAGGPISVPEPPAVGLLVAGVGALAIFKFRKRR